MTLARPRRLFKHSVPEFLMFKGFMLCVTGGSYASSAYYCTLSAPERSTGVHAYLIHIHLGERAQRTEGVSIIEDAPIGASGGVSRARPEVVRLRFGSAKPIWTILGRSVRNS